MNNVLGKISLTRSLDLPQAQTFMQGRGSRRPTNTRCDEIRVVKRRIDDYNKRHDIKATLTPREIETLRQCGEGYTPPLNTRKGNKAIARAKVIEAELQPYLNKMAALAGKTALGLRVVVDVSKSDLGKECGADIQNPPDVRLTRRGAEYFYGMALKRNPENDVLLHAIFAHEIGHLGKYNKNDVEEAGADKFAVQLLDKLYPGRNNRNTVKKLYEMLHACERGK